MSAWSWTEYWYVDRLVREPHAQHVGRDDREVFDERRPEGAQSNELNG